jgi:uncharacterized protein
MRITVSGGSGFIGRALVKELVRRDHQVVQITRESFKSSLDEFVAKKIDGVDAVVNLAGAPVIKRWTDKWKNEIRESRVLTTRRIVEGIMAATVKPKVLISASGIGIYDNIHTHTEESRNFGEGLMAQVCIDWEAEALKAGGVTRVAVLRQGVVLGDGGMLDKLRFPFSVGLGATIGNGRQAFSFIHADDLVSLIVTIIENENMSGIYNAVAPWPTDNRHFTEVLAKVLNQPAFLRIPLFALKLMYGEGSRVVTEGQRVVPERLLKENFPFRYPTIEKALMQILR